MRQFDHRGAVEADAPVRTDRNLGGGAGNHEEAAGPAASLPVCCGLPCEPPLDEYSTAPTRALWYCPRCGAFHEERRVSQRRMED